MARLHPEPEEWRIVILSGEAKGALTRLCPILLLNRKLESVVKVSSSCNLDS